MGAGCTCRPGSPASSYRRWSRSRTREGVCEVDVTDAASLAKAISELEKQMKAAAKRLEFEEAAQLRDRIKELRAQQIYKT